MRDPASNQPTVKLTAIFVCLGGLVVAAALLRLGASEGFGWSGGSVWGAVWGMVAPGTGDSQDNQWSLILNIRLFRVVLAVLVGVSLATSGVALQALLRNPLAEPFILGLSSGAGAGVMLQMLASHHAGFTFLAGGNHVGALLGAAVSMAVVYVAGQRRGVVDPLGLLLSGVVLSTINGAAIVLMSHLLGSMGMRDDLARWMMGFLNEDVSGTATVPLVALATGVGFFVLLAAGPAMDVASFSDTEAMSLGVNLRRLRVTLFLVACVLAAGAVVLAGPIAFVGLICPHAARLLLGPAHRPLIVGSAMIAAGLILLADTATVWLDFGQGRLPLGVLTAALGGPAFIWMLRPHLGRGLE